MSEFTDGMRAAADWYDMHPECQPLYGATIYLPGEPCGHYDDSGNYVEASEAEKVEWLKKCVKAFGSCDKKPGGASYSVVKDFGGKFRLTAVVYGACKKVVTGTRTEVVDEPVETEVRTKKVTKVVEEFAYECPPSLLSS